MDQRTQAWRGASNAQSPPALLTYTFHHAHLQAPPPERATARRWGAYSTEKSAKSNLSAEGFEAWKAQHGAPAGAETDPTFGPMPSTIEEVSNKHVAALLATDGSGEVSQAPIPIAE